MCIVVVYVGISGAIDQDIYSSKLLVSYTSVEYAIATV